MASQPSYQREFRYDEKQQQAVIDTILKGFPLNIMYWSVDDNGNFEMIDGQQRTLSICGFYTHDFNIVDHDRGTLYFSTLTAEEKEKFLNYELTVYFCEGTDKEKLDWFRVINIAGLLFLLLRLFLIEETICAGEKTSIDLVLSITELLGRTVIVDRKSVV